jgi:trans-aconitate methyltransferase
MISEKKWNPEIYDQTLHFVSRYGKELIRLLEPKQSEKILDIGCGTGDLAFEIAGYGADVTGIDTSSTMLDAARKKYPQLHFKTGDAEHIGETALYDKVFSNAAIHWLKNIDQMMSSVYESLVPGGIFVCELGADGNMQRITSAYETILASYNIQAKDRNPWTFLPIEDYLEKLKKQGFQIETADCFERLTPLEGGDDGLRLWLHSFYPIFMYDRNEEEREEIYRQIMHRTRNDLFTNGTWHVDYKRIRVKAKRP